ncbi:hypothetical protein [Sphingobium lactosutens]|uniref:hypothetical protein n=1 Tax=Sphingobium lactosutens TaxID=522773 RepID=UPI001F45D247|nr:hypothetical protein [Sphingobium lactosutens]
MRLIVQPHANKAAQLAEIAQDQVPDRRFAWRSIEIVRSLVEERIGDGRKAGQVVGRSGKRAAETAVGRLQIAVAHEGFEGVGGTLERLAGQFGSASLSAQGHRAPKQGKAMLGKVGFDRRAEGRRISGQHAILAHQRPCGAPIEQAPEDAVDGCGR